jgi:hypothetical protein
MVVGVQWLRRNRQELPVSRALPDKQEPDTTRHGITAEPREGADAITIATPGKDPGITPQPASAQPVQPGEEVLEPRPGQFVIRGLIPLACFFAVLGGFFGLVCAAFGNLRGLIIPTLLPLHLGLRGQFGAFVEGMVQATAEGALMGCFIPVIGALEATPPFGKPHVTLKGYPDRLLRGIVPCTVGGALVLLVNEWFNGLTLWITAGAFRSGIRYTIAGIAGACTGIGVGLLLMRFPGLARLLPFRKRHSVK